MREINTTTNGEEAMDLDRETMAQATECTHEWVAMAITLTVITATILIDMAHHFTGIT